MIKVYLFNKLLSAKHICVAVCKWFTRIMAEDISYYPGTVFFSVSIGIGDGSNVPSAATRFSIILLHPATF